MLVPTHALNACRDYSQRPRRCMYTAWQICKPEAHDESLQFLKRSPLPSSSTRGMPAYSPALYQLFEFQCVPLSTWHTTTPQSPAVYCFHTSPTWPALPNALKVQPRHTAQEEHNTFRHSAFLSGATMQENCPGCALQVYL